MGSRPGRHLMETVQIIGTLFSGLPLAGLQSRDSRHALSPSMHHTDTDRGLRWVAQTTETDSLPLIMKQNLNQLTVDLFNEL